ncbi:MAG: DNA alkylation repair protein [Muribaculaceae bacterium]|nr:DNA alkylation repair protein [Muribaculaceae bacterium]
MTEQIKKEEIKKKLQEIRHSFYAYRNGIVSESLKKLYPADAMIFGLTVPQFNEIAARYGKYLELGRELWKEKNIRESRLLALYILPPELIDEGEAKSMIRDVRSIEEAEMLAFKVLRNLKDANLILEKLSEPEKEFEELNQRDPVRYCLEMFARNLQQIRK